MNERPLRILYVTDEYPPYIGGAGRTIELFAEELVKRGHEVAIATAWHPEAPAFERDGEVAVHRLRDTYSRMSWIPGEPNRRHAPPPFPDPEATFRLRRLISRFRPDVVPAYGWMGHSAAAALMGTGIPLVLFGQDYSNTCARRDLFHRERVCSGPRFGKCLACATEARGVAKGTVATASVFAMRPLLRRQTATVHGASRYVTTVMQRDLGIPAGHAVTIPSFREESEDEPVDLSILGRLPPEDYILFVGALRRVKGLPEVLAAYEQLEDPPPLVVVGPPTPDTPEHFPPGVTVLTSVPHSTVMAMYERALFGVFPSTWPEPLATVVHEAMSKGRPVIATTVGGMVDMIDDGETGLLVEPGDADSLARAMTCLIEDPSLRERLGAAAGERAQRFTAGVVVPELERFYRETVAGFGDARR